MPRTATWLGALALGLALMAPAGAGAQAVPQDQLSQAPRLADAEHAAKAISRAYPRRLRDAGVGGRVHLRFVVSADGSVQPGSVEVMAAEVKALADAAVEAVVGLRFLPGQKDGSPVAAVVVMPINFGTG